MIITPELVSSRLLPPDVLDTKKILRSFPASPHDYGITKKEKIMEPEHENFSENIKDGSAD